MHLMCCFEQILDLGRSGILAFPEIDEKGILWVDTDATLCLELSMVQRAGFEPANHYGLGPHPSAFDQAGRPLQQFADLARIYQKVR